ncbi:MAG TPA: 1,4-alpha-glucan branching protein GlgB [Terriglobales bacterium]|nr:1,4-alpha-glucan branching protein GlgB [Terriglobales bacterium]
MAGELDILHGRAGMRDVVLFSETDNQLFAEGTHRRLHERLGSRIVTRDGVQGAHFAVWAPNADRVSVMGDFNGWSPDEHQLSRGSASVWEGFVPAAAKGSRYKFHIVSRYVGYRVDKADPFAVFAETPPGTASVVWDLAYEWNDSEWMATRAQQNALARPLNIYEVHLGSWRRVESGDRFLNYREIAPLLGDYLKRMNFTHVEFMPVMEHPFYGSWGYQTTSYFAPTSRYGTPQDLMFLIDYLHQLGIGVILDWVPSHFPADEHGLAFFDGTHLFEHADPRKGFHPDWGSYIFNYGRGEVRSFLMSSAMFWLDAYHADGLRLDAVASMLYLDYSRKPGEWVPNQYGGRENLEAIDFLRRFNDDIYSSYPGVQTIAEESSAWPMVSRPTYVGGLGFGMKWDMGWMHDTLAYMANDPMYRKFHHNKLTFRALYAFNENFVLSLSHDEVVYGKGSLLGKMPGDHWQKFANLRLLYAYMYSQPGKKLLFMGSEFGQFSEWYHERSLDWHESELEANRGLQRFVEDMNRMYRDLAAMHERDFDASGFEWVDADDMENSVLSYMRHGSKPGDSVLVVCNFTPVPRHNYRVGVPRGGKWQEIMNSDAALYGGSGHGNMGAVEASPVPYHGRPQSLTLSLPPLAAIFLKTE